jgi:hypothetical protein
MSAELDAWLNPPAAPQGPIKLDLAAYANELQRRHQEFELSQAQQMKAQEARNAVGLRVRERLRPLDRGMEAALRWGVLSSSSALCRGNRG